MFALWVRIPITFCNPSISLLLIILAHTACNDMKPSDNSSKTDHRHKEVKPNPVIYFEIPVQDMERAIRFYSAVFKLEFEEEVIDGNEMALFPFSAEATGISGALAKGEIYKPTTDGVLIYFNTANIDQTLSLALANGGHLLYRKTDNGNGFVAEFKDSEGNRIALFQPLVE